MVPTTSSHALDTSKNLHPLAFPYVYEGTTPPNPDRQDVPHPHQIIEGPNSEIIVPDLGNDRVWIIHRDAKEDSGLKIAGYYQAPAGSGPRHGVVSKDGALISPAPSWLFYRKLTAACRQDSLHPHRVEPNCPRLPPVRRCALFASQTHIRQQHGPTYCPRESPEISRSF